VKNYGIPEDSPLLPPLGYALLDCLRELARVKREYSPVRLSYASACYYRFSGLCTAIFWTEENGFDLHDRLCALGSTVNAQIREVGRQHDRFDLV
jgi:hypothetical protein